MVATSAKVAAVVVVVVVMIVVVAVAATTHGAPGRGAAWSAALGWGRTQGPPRASLRHQRVAKADTRGALATKGTIFWSRIWLAGRPQGWFRDTAEPQLRHGVAVGGPSQKVGGFLRVCSRCCLGVGAFGGSLRCPLHSRERGCRGCERCGDRACAPAAAAVRWSHGLRTQAAGS